MLCLFMVIFYPDALTLKSQCDTTKFKRLIVSIMAVSPVERAAPSHGPQVSSS